MILGLTILFILLLVLAIVFIAIGISKLNIPWLILGTIVIIIATVILTVLDAKVQKEREESIEERCLENNGEVVEYSTTEWDAATKTNKTTVELFCLKDGKLSK